MPVETPESSQESTLRPTSELNALPTSAQPESLLYYDPSKFKTIEIASSPYMLGYAMNDRFDYETKYPPDEQYKEMAPTARLWKTYEDEGGKFDREMVADWRDGLDMLLVFASLFSAVVTAFVSQTCRNLQVDFSQVTASLMAESIAVQRAMLAILEGGESIQPIPAASVTFRSKSSDLWVNGLWFTSLGLSLTTTLLAILVKQWIHQYISLPSGTPLDRSRIRHYRFSGLQKWHVPFIIGFLPVLMHLALGLFFIGLVVYLRPLSLAIAVDMACIAFTAFGIYFACNLLPLYHPDCSYKTPLSSYAYTVLRTVRQYEFFSKFRQNRVVHTRPLVPDSLKDLERDAMNQESPVIDASAVTWLYNTTSNPSVQSIVLQALSSLPLESIPAVGSTVSGVKDILTAINSHYSKEQPEDFFERFQRAAVRFSGYGHAKETNKYLTRLIDTPSAIDTIQSNLLGTPDDSWPVFDVLLWGKVFETSVSQGVEWLGISHDTPSQVWCTLLRFAVCGHICEEFGCGRQTPDVALFTFWMPPDTKWPPLIVNRYDETNRTASTLGVALAMNMRSSFIRWILKVGFPRFQRSVNDHTQGLPDDIFLLLAMLQTPSIQRSSSLQETWGGAQSESLLHSILTVISPYAVNSFGDRETIHQVGIEVDMATITALLNVVTSESFTTNAITPDDKEQMGRILFTGLNRHLDLDRSKAHDFSWLTTNVFENILQIVFACPVASNMQRSLTHMFSYLVFSGARNAAQIAVVHSTLMERHWLEGLSINLSSSQLNDGGKPYGDDPLHEWLERFTSFLASVYVDGLTILAAEVPETFKIVLKNLCHPDNLLTICRILLVADLDTQARLWKLAAIVNLPFETWKPCLQQLCVFAASDDGRDKYAGSFGWPAEGIGAKKPAYLALEEIPAVAACFMKDVKNGHFTPPNYQGSENKIKDPEEIRARWRSPSSMQRYRQQWVQSNAHNPIDPRQRAYIEQAERWHPLMSLMKTGGVPG